VFVVGCLGDWRGSAKVLFESEGLCGDITPSRSERKEIANCLRASPSSYNSFNPARSEGNAVTWPAPIASTLNASFGSKQGLENQHINQGAPLFVPTHARDGKEVLGTLTASYGTGGVDLETKPLVHNVAYNITFCDANGTRKDRPDGGLYVNETDTSNTLTRAGVGTNVIQGFDAYNNSVTGNVTKTLDTGSDYHHVPNVFQDMRVRRLTPIECERLQGFPDNYTNTPTSSDTTRYKALGNSMAVPVMKWIGNRIAEIDNE
jgi:DNA (cytosine-5)-methyltransferase 1